MPLEDYFGLIARNLWSDYHVVYEMDESRNLWSDYHVVYEMDESITSEFKNSLRRYFLYL